MAADGTSIHTRRYNFWPPRGLTPSPTSSIYTHTESTTQSTLPYEDASTANSYITSGKQRATVTSSITPASKHSTDQLYSTTAKSTSTAGGGHITSAATSTRRSSKTIVTSGGQTSASAGAQTAFQSKDLTLTPHVHKAAIAGIVIGSLSILALSLIAYLLWRRRRRRRQGNEMTSDVASDRAPSTTTFLSAKTRDGNLTALPMRKKPEVTAEGLIHESPDLPMRVRDRLSAHHLSFTDLWKTANPPTPQASTFSLARAEERRSSSLRPPEMPILRRTTSHNPTITHNPMIRVSSHGLDTYHTPLQSVHNASTLDLESYAWLDAPSSQQFAGENRHSWAETFATAKSRLDARSLGSTITSLPGFRNLKRWMPTQSERQQLPNQSQAGPSRTNSGKMFKNKATKPNLAPVPTRQLSRRQFSTDSSTADKKEPSVDSKEVEDYDSIIPDDGVIS